MKRRAFLRGAGVASGAVLTGRLWRTARAARSATLERLHTAEIALVARVGALGGASLAELKLGPTAEARRELKEGSLTLRAVPAPGSHEVHEAHEAHSHEAHDSHDSIDLTVTFRPRPHVPCLGVSLALDLARWSRDAYVLLPGACYAGNRFESRFVGYPPLLTEPADIGPHVPPIITDIPRLNIHPGPSRLELGTTDLATPAVASFLPESNLGLILLVDPTSGLGLSGLSVTESDDRTHATLAFGAPFVNERRRTPGEGAPRERPAPAPVRPGQTVTLRARLHAFDCAEIAELTARLFAARKALTGPTARPRTFPFSAAFAAHEARVNARFLPKQGFFALGAREDAYTIWQTGWCGGFGQTLPLLAAGDKRSRERARQTIAFALDGQAPSGFFHGISDGKTWYDDGFSAPRAPTPPDASPPRAPPSQHRRWHLVRRSADALALLVKQIALLERQAAAAPRDAPPPPIDPAWTAAARRCAEALARLWERHHQFGQFIDVESGELIVGGSSSAGSAPAALALAAGHLKEPRYLHIAEEAGLALFDRFVRAGLTCGGPGDVLQCPDSESAAALLESFVTLYEVTRDRVWIPRARAAAHLLATWVISYDAPGGGPRTGAARATGAVFTDAQNRVGAPGYVLSSGSALFRLYRATGEAALLDLLRDTVANLSQYLPRPEGSADKRDDAARRDAAACARADTSDWVEAQGGVVPTAGLYDAISLLSYSELPGVYAQTDTGFVFAFDHLDARVKERLAAAAGAAGGHLVVALRNPTAHDATVRLYAETAADAALPLRADAVLDAPTTVVPAGATVEVAMPPITAPPRG
jgi:hypothetical protein